jgi:putative ABC transport system permease protein
MGTLWQDARYGARMLRRQPAFTAVAVVALALGVGANTAIFSVVNAVLLRPFPFREQERIVGVWEATESHNRIEVSPGNFADWRRHATDTFEQMAVLNPWSANLAGDGAPERLQGFQVSPSFFPMLGVEPVLGRTFTAEEEQPGRDSVVVISHGLWQRRFAGDASVLNRALNINGRAYTVVGVMPPDFQLHRRAELWSPFAPDERTLSNRIPHYLIVYARLRANVTPEQARASMRALAGNIARENPQTNAGWSANVVPLREQAVGDVETPLLLLLGAVGFVLLIACANVANLLLARAASRSKEIAIRTALGAGRLRIVRQLLTESVLLALAGGLLGLLLAAWGVDLLVANLPSGAAFSLPRAEQIGIDSRVLAFTLLVSLLTGLVFGLAPALHATKTDLGGGLKEGGRTSGAGAPGRRLRSALVVAEVALSVVLLVGAGLLVRSIVGLMRVDPGFDGEGVMTMRLTLPRPKYAEDAKATAFLDQVLERVKGLPGVESAGATSQLPLGGSNASTSFQIDGQPPLAPSERPGAAQRVVSPDFFRTLRIPVVEGRAFTEGDDANAPRAVVVSQMLAQKFFPGGSAVGRRIRSGAGDGQLYTIVGVVGDVKHFGLKREPEPTLYFTHKTDPGRSMVLTVRASEAGLAESLAPLMRREVLAVDPDQPVFDVRTAREAVAQSVSLERAVAFLLSVFAAVAMLMAAVGIFGVMSYAVTQRTQEIGVRMALGAQRGDILRLFLRHGLALALVGAGVGLAGAFALMRVLGSLVAGLLYGVSAADPLTYAGVALALVCVALAACYVPARRATKVDPMQALRYE